MEKILNIPSSMDNLREVEKAIDEFSSECQINEDKYGKILIAVLEAANNAIMHGNKLDINKEVRIGFKLDKKKLQVSVEDKGEGFDYESIPDPTAPENIEKVNGRGIFLMKQLSDRISFNDDGTIVELEFDLNSGNNN